MPLHMHTVYLCSRVRALAAPYLSYMPYHLNLYNASISYKKRESTVAQSFVTVHHRVVAVAIVFSMVAVIAVAYTVEYASYATYGRCYHFGRFGICAHTLLLLLCTFVQCSQHLLTLQCSVVVHIHNRAATVHTEHNQKDHVEAIVVY
jgi:hypothetical protein